MFDLSFQKVDKNETYPLRSTKTENIQMKGLITKYQSLKDKKDNKYYGIY